MTYIVGDQANGLSKTTEVKPMIDGPRASVTFFLYRYIGLSLLLLSKEILNKASLR